MRQTIRTELRDAFARALETGRPVHVAGLVLEATRETHFAGYQSRYPIRSRIAYSSRPVPGSIIARTMHATGTLHHDRDTAIGVIARKLEAAGFTVADLMADLAPNPFGA